MSLRERAIELASAALDLADEVGRRECGDTVPAPPTVRESRVEDDEPSSDELARGFGWIDDPSEPPCFGERLAEIDTHFVARNVVFERRVAEGLAELLEPEQLCAGARVSRAR